LILLIALGFARAAEATKVAPVPLTKVITEARAIFVGRVVEVSPVEFDFEEERHICGFRYRAQIEQAFKGPTQPVEFFDPSSDDPLAPGDRFLAFLFSYDVARQIREDAATNIQSLSQARYRCQLPFIAITVNESPRTLMRFSDRFDDADWLVLPPNAAYFSPDARMRRSIEDPGLWGFVRWEDLARKSRAPSKNERRRRSNQTTSAMF